MLQDNRVGGPAAGVLTGLRDLSALMIGLEPGDQVVIVGRHS